jgi:hypothetical protein
MNADLTKFAAYMKRRFRLAVFSFWTDEIKRYKLKRQSQPLTDRANSRMSETLC